jgi:hypothetical protein
VNATNGGASDTGTSNPISAPAASCPPTATPAPAAK